jgi:6-phosphogluconate dehydrogenase
MTSEQTEPKQAQFGMIGLAVMGRNLALNVEEHGFPVAVWNLETQWVDSFVNEYQGKQIIGTKTLGDFARALERPRRIMMMIKAGTPVDMTIESLKPLLEEGDVVIDGGNSYYKDTQRREESLRQMKINFIGSGVSGGEEGARFGPSLMPGGAREAYENIRPVFEAIAAKTDSGACVTYVGPDGAGHFVKMVHNGIEYGDMQLIAEAYDILRNALGLGAEELARIFSEWNKGDLNSFLIEITARIFTVKDPGTGRPLVDMVLDAAGQKGTGKWTAEVALDLGVVIPTMQAAIDARALSARKAERVEASKQLSGPSNTRYEGDKQALVDAVHDALYASKICSYAQGMNLIRKGSEEYGWDINLGELSRIWKGGCIIRAQFLDKIKQAYQRRPDLPNLLLDPDFKTWVMEAQPRWRQAVTTAQSLGIPAAAMSASLAYFDTYRTENLPLNLTQAQRDFFGSHTYKRVDNPDGEAIHTEWEQLAKQ